MSEWVPFLGCKRIDRLVPGGRVRHMDGREGTIESIEDGMATVRLDDSWKETAPVGYFEDLGEAKLTG